MPRSAPAPASRLPPPDAFTLARLRWLVRLRWVAMLAILGASSLAWAGFFPGVVWPLLVATGAAGLVYNAVLFGLLSAGRAPLGRSSAMVQAVVDMAILTVVLWAAGGVHSPFLGYFVFHVALIGILGGRSATLVAALSAVAGAGLLAMTEIVPGWEIGAWHPVGAWEHIADFVAFTTTVGAVAYFVTHAVRELQVREGKVAEARDRAALQVELLTTTLDGMDAGLEVIAADGTFILRNKRAEELVPLAGARWHCPGDQKRPCERDASGVCPIREALATGTPGRCRFTSSGVGRERIYELLVTPLHGKRDGAVMNLYLDRTSETLSEHRLLLAERLASLGRIAQGVAHELNTPLATVRTLSSDMRVALRMLLAESDPAVHASLVRDVDESAALIHDETRRLGRITQSLLAGGDLVRAHVDGAVRLAAVVERARALVFAGAREGAFVEVSPDVDDLSVIADPDHLVQILVNLLQNAHDAVREKRGKVAIRAGRTADGVVVISVEDDGPGIDPQIASRIFEPFATTKPPGQGTGLGLYTSYMLATAMGGVLSVETRKSGGTRASVRLPAAATRNHRTPLASMLHADGE